MAITKQDTIETDSECLNLDPDAYSLARTNESTHPESQPAHENHDHLMPACERDDNAPRPHGIWDAREDATWHVRTALYLAEYRGFVSVHRDWVDLARSIWEERVRVEFFMPSVFVVGNDDGTAELRIDLESVTRYWQDGWRSAVEAVLDMQRWGTGWEQRAFSVQTWEGADSLASRIFQQAWKNSHCLRGRRMVGSGADAPTP